MMGNALSPLWALVITTFMFAILHFRFGRTLVLLPLFLAYGSVYGLCNFITGRLSSSIVAHASTSAYLILLGGV